MSRVYNFSAGPAALPLEVLETIRNDIPDWQGTGMSVMEVSHRGKHFVELAARAEANIRQLLGIPDEFVTYDMMALGTTDFQPAVKKMRALSEVIHYGQCDQKDFRTDEEVSAYFNKG